MKLVCSQSDLKNNLSLVSRAVPSRAEPAVLSNVLIEAVETTQKVSMIAFDGNLRIKTSFHAEVIEGGKITLPAKLFNDIVTRLPEMEITLNVDDEEDNYIAIIDSLSGQFRLTGIDAEEFPQLPVVDTGEEIELPIDVLKVGLGGCLFAVSNELSKQVLTGVHLKAKELGENNSSILEFAATDSHRLAVVATSLDQDDADNPTPISLPPELAFTIPAKALRELEKMIGDADADARVKVKYDESVIIFELGDPRSAIGNSRLLTTAKIPGDYPAYGQLIPRSFLRETVLDRKRLLNSLELVAVLAQKNNLVKFSLNGEQGELTVSADAQDIGNAQQTLPAQIMGEDIEIAFNIKYLMDGLKALSAAEIKMQLNEGHQPVIFTPLGELDMTYLVMPIQIRN